VYTCHQLYNIVFPLCQESQNHLIHEDIKELNKKRKEYIAQKHYENYNGLGRAMLNAIKTQAEKKIYVWN